MGDRDDLDTVIRATFYTKEIAISKFKLITRYCERKEIPSTIGISYNVYGKFYSVSVRTNKKHEEEIKDLIFLEQ